MQRGVGREKVEMSLNFSLGSILPSNSRKEENMYSELDLCNGHVEGGIPDIFIDKDGFVSSSMCIKNVDWTVQRFPDVYSELHFVNGYVGYGLLDVNIKKRDGFSIQDIDWKLETSHNHTVNKAAFEGQHGGMKDDDILCQLPEDPFGMDSSYIFPSMSYCKHESSELQDCVNFNTPEGGSSPHDALFFALGYLNVLDLLSIEGVCRSLWDAVRGDPRLWRSIHIGEPLNVKITDKALVQLTSRAQGTLQCLRLVDCPNITDNGLRHVVESNPKISELYLPGCRKLTIEGILSNLRASKATGMPGIKRLRFGGRFDVTKKQFEELISLVYSAKHMGSEKPLFRRIGQLDLSYDDDRAIDIEVCPKCQKLSLVYDCPSESCQRKYDTAESCRACAICIARCFECGRCIEDRRYNETFDLKNICLECFEEWGEV